MYQANYTSSIQYGIEYLERMMQGGTLENYKGCIQNLARNEGSRDGSLLVLRDFPVSKALWAYFREHDLTQVKQWAYVAAKLHIMRQHLDQPHEYISEELLWPLLSDNEEIIDWWRQNAAPFEQARAPKGYLDNPKTWLYYRYQLWLALNARWDELGERAERILAMQDQIKKDRPYLIDQHFYLALARGDQAQMEAVLLEKCTPKLRRKRYEQESGVSNHFIVSYATLFAKLAWRNGYQLEIDTPWIPKEWLPIQALTSYEDPWPFMQEFNIWQPFEGDWEKYSPKR